ncbi:MAG: bacillithiol biosynthesis BshC, partial [Chitinophagaceae bacterium]
KIFEPVILKEIETQFSHNALEPVKNALGKHYKAQTSGRELNLFYLIDDKRERIEKEGDIFKIKTLDLSFSREEIIEEVKNFPEKFSGNVVLRGPFQETILPNLAFIGGGGELAYWMELKKVFEAADISYPVLLLRNSFLLLNTRQQKNLEQLGFTVEELFKTDDELTKQYVLNNTDKSLLPKKELEEINKIYSSITEKAKVADTTLEKHVLALKAKNEKLLHGLEKKIIRAEKRKNEEAVYKIQQLKAELFPAGNLQERQENFAGFYARYGCEWLDKIAGCSKGLSQEFTVAFFENEN